LNCAEQKQLEEITKACSNSVSKDRVRILNDRKISQYQPFSIQSVIHVERYLVGIRTTTFYIRVTGLGTITHNLYRRYLRAFKCHVN